MKKSRERRFPKCKYIIPCSLLILIVLFIQEGFAGGIYIYEEDVRLNGYLPGSSFQAGQDITMSYTAETYSFSGDRSENEYGVFLITKISKIQVQSVGYGGKNRPNDVIVIQQRLKELDLFQGTITGKSDDHLIEAIKAFQKKIGFTKPDGRIDPGGTTLRKLFEEGEPEIFVQLARTYLYSENRDKLTFSIIFTAPKQAGTYLIEYCQIPLFTDRALGKLINTGGATQIDLNEADMDLVKRHIARYNKFFASLCDFKIVSEKSVPSPAPTVYLRVNGKVPGREPLIFPGVLEEPIKFSWWVEKPPSVTEIMYRYQLYPDDSEWSSWQTSKEVLYYFINHGHHEFRLETTYQDESGEEKRTPQVNYSFTLDAPFISKPVSKGFRYGDDSGNTKTIPVNLYSGSKALLIGVSQYEDKSFEILPYIKEDLMMFQSALEQNGFEVTRLEGNVTREQIFTAIDKLISSAQEGDRIIIYFSSHGFQDEYSPTDGYVATSNCDTENPDANCISLGYLHRTVKKFLNKPVKHILLVADSCFSGLGVLTKKTGYPEIAKIAIKDGAHMMTAGMADQEAEMDHTLKMSTFTHFLTKGLLGAADYTNDGIVTLTELHLFVQYEVANKTLGTQIPMIGRISGEGEIIFDNR